MLLRLQRYDLDLKHYPGKSIRLAETLSLKEIPWLHVPYLSEGLDLQVNIVKSSLSVSDRKIEEIKSQTEIDEQLSMLKKVILQGWPETRNQSHQILLLSLLIR
jgi:hypothetical protein